MSWSFVWGACMLSLGISSVRGGSLLLVIFVTNGYEIKNLGQIIPFYAFIVWVMGCVIIVVVLSVIDVYSEWRKQLGK